MISNDLEKELVAPTIISVQTTTGGSIMGIADTGANVCAMSENEAKKYQDHLRAVAG